MKTRIFTIIALLINLNLFSQETKNNKQNEKFSLHVQTTIINQTKYGFSAKYSGEHSLSTEKESQTSITSTLFLGAKTWKGGEIFLNPEIAGGSGLSSVYGVGDATNGETFRIGSPEPKVYVARLFMRQTFPLSSDRVRAETDANQLAGKVPTQYIRLTVGKIGLTDIFDDNSYSHDPRTQFMCWGLMANGAWDYAANTRGYTPSAVFEYVNPKNEFRYVVSLIPTYANGPIMNREISKAKSQTAEYTHRISYKNRSGAIRLLGFYTNGYLGSYDAAVTLNRTSPAIENVRKLGGYKYGFGINAEQQLSDNLGAFLRASWNDGKYETWAFTEIDHSISGGISLTGQRWHRPDDTFGAAQVISGISKPHQNYIKAGGLGFMLGDGNLNYKLEKLTEIYYSAGFKNRHIFVTGAYQLLINPGYNGDRHGPVNILSVRLHSEF